MESIDLKSLNLTIEESRDIINSIAKERGISTEKLLSTIKPNPKRKNNKILTIKTQQNMTKTQQTMTKTQQNMAKIQQHMVKTQNMAKTQQKLRKTQETNKITKNTTKTNKITTKII